MPEAITPVWPPVSFKLTERVALLGVQGTARPTLPTKVYKTAGRVTPCAPFPLEAPKRRLSPAETGQKHNRCPGQIRNHNKLPRRVLPPARAVICSNRQGTVASPMDWLRHRMKGAEIILSTAEARDPRDPRTARTAIHRTAPKRSKAFSAPTCTAFWALPGKQMKVTPEQESLSIDWLTQNLKLEKSQ